MSNGPCEAEQNALFFMEMQKRDCGSSGQRMSRENTNYIS